MAVSARPRGAPVAAGVPEQRRDPTVGATVHLADEEHVIAGRMQRVVSALDPGGTAFDEGYTTLSFAVHDAGEPVRVRTGEASSELNLVMRQNVDRVALGPREYSQAARSPGQAPDDQRGVERNGIEGVRSEPNEDLARATGSHDGYTGRKLGQRSAEAPFRDGGAERALGESRHREPRGDLEARDGRCILGAGHDAVKTRSRGTGC